jgi:hypothetical protein
VSIVTSIIVEDRAQIDGRRAVRERHTDHLGAVADVSYLAEADANAAAIMTARVPLLEAGAASTEMARNIAFIVVGEYEQVTANYITVADARATIRALYQTENGEIIGRLAGFLLTLTDAVLRTLFNMTQAQVNQLKTRLQTKVDALNVVLTMVGE